MDRDHGSRLIGTRSARQLSAALVTLTLTAVAMVLFMPSAHADSASVTMGSGNLGTVTITSGDTVSFVSPSTFKGVTLYTGWKLSGPGIPTGSQVVARGTSYSIQFPGPGTAGYAWKCQCAALKVPTGGVTVQVNDPPPPPVSSTPVDPGSSTPAGGGTSGVPTSGVPTSPGAGSSGATSPGGKPSGSKTSGGGISIGPVPVTQTQNGIPIGFNGPGADPNQSTPAIPDPGSGVGAIPTGANATVSLSNAPSQDGSIVEVAKSTPSKSRPTSLAIVSILVLAVVSTLYAYRRLGEQATRPGH